MPGTGHIDHIQIVFLDNSVETSTDKILSLRCSPMAQQHPLYMAHRQWLAQQRISA